MYPTIHNFDANPLHAYPTVGGSSSGSGAGSSAGAGTPATAAAAAPRANGPPPPPPAAFPTLQVTIDPRFQVAPPVRAPSQPPGQGSSASQPGSAVPPPPPGHPAPGASGEPLDLILERRLVQELASSSSGGDAGGTGAGPGSASAAAAATAAEQGHEDPYEVLLGRYIEMGFTREEVAMALAVVGPDHGADAERIVDACRKYKHICSMGFRPQHVAGALVVHDGNTEAAVATCLETTS
ncbi:hypothetical protein ABPG75_007486 [Micractinium tetrahymenae]